MCPARILRYVSFCLHNIRSSKKQKKKHHLSIYALLAAWHSGSRIFLTFEQQETNSTRALSFRFIFYFLLPRFFYHHVCTVSSAHSSFFIKPAFWWSLGLNIIRKNVLRFFCQWASNSQSLCHSSLLFRGHGADNLEILDDYDIKIAKFIAFAWFDRINVLHILCDAFIKFESVELNTFSHIYSQCS